MSSTPQPHPQTSAGGFGPNAYVDDRPDAPLGTLLFRAGLVPEDELRDALELSISEGRRLGEVLLERGLVGERDLTRILASQKGLPFVELRDRSIDPEAVRLLPAEKVQRWGALPIGFEDGLPVVAVGDASNRRLFGQVTEALGRKPRFVVAVPSDLADAIGAVHGRPAEPGSPERDVPPAESVSIPRGTIQAFVALSNGERLALSPPTDEAAALDEARKLIRSLDERVPGTWPFVGGRFLRPDAVISVDVVESPPAGLAGPLHRP